MLASTIGSAVEITSNASGGIAAEKSSAAAATAIGVATFSGAEEISGSRVSISETGTGFGVETASDAEVSAGVAGSKSAGAIISVEASRGPARGVSAPEVSKPVVGKSRAAISPICTWLSRKSCGGAVHRAVSLREGAGVTAIFAGSVALSMRGAATPAPKSRVGATRAKSRISRRPARDCQGADAGSTAARHETRGAKSRSTTGGTISGLGISGRAAFGISISRRTRATTFALAADGRTSMGPASGAGSTSSGFADGSGSTGWAGSAAGGCTGSATATRTVSTIGGGAGWAIGSAAGAATGGSALMRAAGAGSATAAEASADFDAPLRGSPAEGGRASESRGGATGGNGAGFVATAARDEAGGELVLVSPMGVVLMTGFDFATGFDSAAALDAGANLALASPFARGDGPSCCCGSPGGFAWSRRVSAS